MAFSAMEKRGASHLGFVLSFVIFIMFIIFMFSAIEPFLKTQASKQSLLDFLRFSLVDEVETNDLTTMTIDLDGSGTKECVKITGGTAREILESAGENQNLKVKDESNNLVDYEIQGNGQFILDVSGSYVGILKVYSGNEIESSEGTLGSDCDNIDANIDSIKNETQIIESNIFSLLENYGRDYEQLKTDLEIEEENEFTFSFELVNGSLIEPQIAEIPDTNVYATEFPLQYLDENGNYQIGFMTIRVW